jgi:cytochrome c oxidase subunit 4
MTLAESRGIKGPPERPQHAVPHEQAHPGPLEYLRIGLILAVITAVEVAVYYVDELSDVLVPILVVLSGAKFSLVVLWFMHLKFDARLFSWMFVGGILLASTLFVVVLATLGSGLT